MAQFPQGFMLLAAALTVTLHSTLAGSPAIRLSAHEGPILEGTNVTLECLMEEEGENITRLTFQKFHQWFHTWITLDKDSLLHCWFFDVDVKQDGDHLQLNLNDLRSSHAGTYRCASLNATGNTSVSEELKLQVEYLHKVFLTQSNSWCGTVGKSITLREGSNLELRCSADASQVPNYEWYKEGEDWIVSSESLTVAKVNKEHAGIYTCRARHPVLPQLTKTKSIRLFVGGSERGFSLDSVMMLNKPMLALAVALPALLLLLLILAIAIAIPRRRAAARKKAALEDSTQRTPIYKGSLESVPSVTADTHPLVM